MATVGARISIPKVEVTVEAEYHGVSPEDPDFVDFCEKAAQEQALYGNKIISWKQIPGGISFKVAQGDNREQVEASQR